MEYLINNDTSVMGPSICHIDCPNGFQCPILICGIDCPSLCICNHGWAVLREADSQL